jgi:hypothetical protein
MKRIVALVFVVAVLVSAVFASAAGAVPSPPSNGQGGGQLGPGNGKCTAGSLASPGTSWGANWKCILE